MKVLILGLPRTGTQSLADALIQLGFSPIYHMREVGKNKHQTLWIEAINAKFDPAKEVWNREQFEQILGGFEAVCDYPAAIFPEELVAAYPEAPIILTTRSEDAWYASMMSTLIHMQSKRGPDDPSPMAALSRLYSEKCWGSTFEETGRAFFHKHNDTVRALGRGRKFLEWEAREGWGPVCEFLGYEIPDAPFPRSDDWVEYKKMVEQEKARLSSS